ncbi:Quinolinate phosphoribosyl transferase [Lactarius deliciosus]|nr:Quinolinate phosphoribosyl transferase [Lactarius deliciosus]
MADFVVGEDLREAFLWGKGSKCAVLASTPFVDEILRLLDCTVEWHVAEGDEFEQHVATVRGKARYLLLGERIALNLLARCSGIATASKCTKDLADSYGFRGVIAGTRKTTPGIYTASCARMSFHNADLSLSGFRLVEKYGMIVGGIDSKSEFRVCYCGDFPLTRSWGLGFSLLLDVEVRDEEAHEAIASGAGVIMLDISKAMNLCPSHATSVTAGEEKGRSSYSKREGGITEGNLRERAISGRWTFSLLQAIVVITNRDRYLSTNFEHQSVQHIDFSLKIRVPLS